MGKTYRLPEREVIDVLEKARDKFHRRLVIHDVRIGLIMAHAGVDENGDIKGTALSGYGGTGAAASVSNVPLKDRLVKRYDVEILIDGDCWPKYTEEEKLALVDHELTHIIPTGEKDDLDRPVIKMRKEDFMVWGFHEIMDRHGAASGEAQGIQRLVQSCRQPALTTIVEEYLAQQAGETK